MAFTPSTDQRRRDREQRKRDKRLARENARIEKLEAERAARKSAEEAAALEAYYKTPEGILAKEEADFEVKLLDQEQKLNLVQNVQDREMLDSSKPNWF